MWETAEKLEETRADTERLMLDIVKPLIIEEAIKSGLFPCLSKDLLKLAKTYHRYNFHVTHMNEVQTRGEEAGGAYTESLPYKRADERLRQGEDEVVENSQKLLMKLCQ